MTNTKEKLSILIVDDDNFLLDIYTVKFKEYGAQVSVALSSADALRMLRESVHPDILIVDMVMPGMDGVAFLEEVRKNKLAPQAVPIVLSNQSQKEDIDRAMAAGARGYIVKASRTPSEVLHDVLSIFNDEHKV